VEALEGGRVAVTFDESQRALAPGQICAFYAGDELVGGGIFETVTPEREA
jgi:tRNA-specific 2-thiouridylase